MFTKILIANRGEIAVRVIRACREMGIAPVAVYSEADREALHVRMADEAYLIGPPSPAESYLAIDKILEAARLSGSQAIHPGYGFLSENPAFPEACERAGVVFIGPGAEAMRLMGHKVAARKAMIESGVPVVPGSEVLPEEPAAARREAERAVGEGQNRIYPILLKAAAGGGGKGMRIVGAAGEFESAYAQARSEARSSFGNPSVYAEKYLVRPRHIEVQVLADTRGATLHLGERECTIQRRHQKLIEECPSPVVDGPTRVRLGDMAVRAARAAGYVGAGTCEFLRDAGGSFYFMEMNARLQVEHPVTEMVTGLDLVKLQIRIAMGEGIPFDQDAVAFRGWAIECRIFAEDPSRGFMPSPGKIGTLRQPSGPGIRDDSGVYQGYRVPVHYDPMISKLIAWGTDREEAVARMRRALDEYRIEGVRTTIPFHRRVFRHPAFLASDFDTSFVETHGAEVIPQARPPKKAPPDGPPPADRKTKLTTDPRRPAIGPYDTLPPGLATALEAAWEPEETDEAGGESPTASQGATPRSGSSRSSRKEARTPGPARTSAPEAAPSDPAGARTAAGALPLSSADVAIVTVAIAAHEKARAFAGETTAVAARGLGESVRLPDERASRSGAPSRRGWRETARMEGLRDGRG